jgi:hypothetical protein
MSFFAWLRNRISMRSMRVREAYRPAALRFRPQIEVLEGRDVPSTLTVTNNLDNGSKGSLRYEIDRARSRDTIVFAPSLDGQTITLTGSELDIAKSLNIQGPGAGLLTISGGRSSTSRGSRVFLIEPNANVTLSGLTITGGEGTALWVEGSSPIDNYGGGIYNGGTLTVSGCTVSGNYCDPNSASSYGGGIANFGTLTVSNSTVSDNYATEIGDVSLNPPPTNEGGGIYNAGTLTVSNSTISGNFAFGDGGGIYNAGTAAALTVLDSIFSSNTPDNIVGPYTDGGGNTFK